MRPQFVLFGSSIVELSFNNGGWGSILSNIYSSKADMVVRGYPGWNSRRGLQVLDEVFPKDAEVQPTLVIAYFGGNDAMPTPHLHVPLPEYIENMTKIAAHLKSLSEETRVIFLSAPALSEKFLYERWGEKFLNSGITNELRRQYSDAWIEKCNELGLKVVDMWTALQQRDDWDTACFDDTDGLHLSTVGNNIVAEEIKRILKEAEWEPSLNWELMPIQLTDDSIQS